MSHHEPLTPMPRRNELDRMLDRAAVPCAPADLAARISHDVPRMAQIEPLPNEFEDAAPHLVKPHLVKQGAARGWMLAGGLGALAASVAALTLGSPSGAPSPSLPKNVPLAASVPAVSAVPERAAVRMAQVPMAAPLPQAAQLAVAPKRVATPPANLAPMRDTPPAALASSQPEALAAIAPLAPAAAADPSGPPTMKQRGLMGPVLPQGYGYSGGGSVAIPPSAPIKMSGGPGSN